VLGGLQAASTAQTTLNFENMSRLISSLDPRVFIVHNIHDERGPILMHSRWSMSYLCGPLTRPQVKMLMEPQRRALELQSPPVAVANQTPSVVPIYRSADVATPVHIAEPGD
jgi:hypothetical protein